VAAPASPLEQRHRPLLWRGPSTLREAPDEFGTYEFQVVARNIADAVMSIGGLIFDRAMAGWDVSVVVDGEIDGTVDDRSVRIWARASASGCRVRLCSGAASPARACGCDGRRGQECRGTPAGSSP
jgi:hypothetical protein